MYRFGVRPIFEHLRAIRSFAIWLHVPQRTGAWVFWKWSQCLFATMDECQSFSQHLFDQFTRAHLSPYAFRPQLLPQVIVKIDGEVLVPQTQSLKSQLGGDWWGWSHSLVGLELVQMIKNIPWSIR